MILTGDSRKYFFSCLSTMFVLTTYSANAEMRPEGYIDTLRVVAEKPAYKNEIPQLGSSSYKVIRAVVHGKLDPNAKVNSGIVNIEKADKDSDGFVSYSTDVLILTPSDPNKAKRSVIYEVANRGGALGKYTFIGGGDFVSGDAPDGKFPSLLEKGYTIIWSGWQGDLPLAENPGENPTSPLGVGFPVAKDKDGQPIIDLSREEFIPDVQGGNEIKLTYPPADINDRTLPQLTARQSWFQNYGQSKEGNATFDAPMVSVSNWQYKKHDDGTYTVSFTPPDFVYGPNRKKVKPDEGTIYNFTYKAKSPTVNGIGYAAVRDLMTFLRYSDKDRHGNANPLNALKSAGCGIDICDKTTNFDTAVAEGISQSGRFLRDYLYQGFNTDSYGNKVFEGLMPIAPGARRMWLNTQFSQPGRWSRPHGDHFMEGFDFPFAYNVIKDFKTGKVDGLLKKCRDDNTCPKIMQIDGSFEWWQAGGSLVTTDGNGKDLKLPDNVRYYLIPGSQHTGNSGVTTGFPKNSSYSPMCALPESWVSQDTVDRALMAAMFDWVESDKLPPASKYPLVSDKTAVDIDDVSLPSFSNLNIPQEDSKNIGKMNVSVVGQVNPLYPISFNNAVPSVDISKKYHQFVPQVDKNGNEVSGLPVPEVAVPLATYTGWNYRKEGHAFGEACYWFGASIPLAKNNETKSSLDTRESLADLYKNREDFQQKVKVSSESLVAQGYLLERDAKNFYQSNSKLVSYILLPN